MPDGTCKRLSCIYKILSHAKSYDMLNRIGRKKLLYKIELKATLWHLRASVPWH